MIRYVCSYITKGEPVNRTELEKAVMVALEKENSKAMEDLRYQIGIHFIRNREISAQEACAILMSLPFVYASGTVEYLDSNQPDRRVEVMRSFKPDDINAKVKLPSKLDKYRSRPLMPEFENLSMMEFHSKFDLISKTDADRRNAARIKRGMPLQLQGCMLFPLQSRIAYCRTVPIIIRVRPEPCDPEECAYHYISLLFPHREERDLLGCYDCFVDHFSALKEANQLNVAAISSIHFQTKIRDDIEAFNLRKAINISEITNSTEKIVGNQSLYYGVHTDDIDGVFRDFLRVNLDEAPIIQDRNFGNIRHNVPKNWRERLGRMNDQQKSAFNHVLKTRASGGQLLLFITGGAGRYGFAIIFQYY